MNNFQITSLQDTDFSYLFELTSGELQKAGAVKMVVDKKTGFSQILEFYLSGILFGFLSLYLI